MVFSLLAGRRECAVLFRAQTLEDGQDRSKADARHQKAIEELQYIYDTLEYAVTSAPSQQTLSAPVANRSGQHDDNRYMLLGGLRSHDADDTPFSPEQRDVPPTSPANTTNASPPADYESSVMRSLEAMAPIRRFVRTTRKDYPAGKSDLYEATEITRHAFALSLEVVAELNAATPTESKLLLESSVRLGERSQKSAAAKSDHNDLCYARASGILELLREYADLMHDESKNASARRGQVNQRCKDYHPLASCLCALAMYLPERAKRYCKRVTLYERTDPLLPRSGWYQSRLVVWMGRWVDDCQ
jgi:hypothetical protein